MRHFRDLTKALAHFACTCIPCIWVESRCFRQDLTELTRYPRVEEFTAPQRFVLVFPGQAEGYDHPGSVHIAARIRLAISKLLGRSVAGSSETHRVPSGFRTHLASDAQIQQNKPLTRKHDVRRFHIPVNDGRIERFVQLGQGIA
jgi:hypothetical protein